MGIKLTRLTALTALTTLALTLGVSGRPAFADASHHLSGGGTATISQVAINVWITDSGDASGSFECLMAGRSAFVLPAFGLSHIMAVHATPSAGTISGSVATLSGAGQLIMDGGQKVPIHMQAWVDVSTQQFELTVVEVGTLPVETLLSGHISLR